MKKLLLVSLLLVLLTGCKNKNIDSYVGNYYGDGEFSRVTLTVEKTDNKTLSFEVSWSSSYAEREVWRFSAESKDNEFKYTNAERLTEVYDETDFTTKEVWYTYGVGSVSFSDGKALWHSSMNEPYDGDITFIKY